MSIHGIIAQLDKQIASLQQAKELLAGNAETAAPRRGPGRPRSTGSASDDNRKVSRKRTMSAEGRRRIAEAQKKRWAAKKAKA